VLFFFFKQKTAYEMRISDWSSDVCSSDLHWPDIERVIGAIRHRTVTPSLILKKLSAYRQQNSLAAALREIGRIERTLFTLRWFEDPALRRTVTAELNKGEIGRASGRERVGQYVEVSVGADTLKKKN